MLDDPVEPVPWVMALNVAETLARVAPPLGACEVLLYDAMQARFARLPPPWLSSPAGEGVRDSGDLAARIVLFATGALRGGKKLPLRMEPTSALRREL